MFPFLSSVTSVETKRGICLPANPSLVVYTFGFPCGITLFLLVLRFFHWLPVREMVMSVRCGIITSQWTSCGAAWCTNMYQNKEIL